MLAAAMTAATTTGAGVKGSMRRHDITAWNSAAQALTCQAVLFCNGCGRVRCMLRCFHC